MDERQNDPILALTVDLLLDLRAQYLAGGANPLKHWDQLSTRLRSAARRASGVEDWHTMMCRSLQLESPSKNNCHSLIGLVREIDTPKKSQVWLDMLEQRWGLVIATARLTAEQRKEEREE